VLHDGGTVLGSAVAGADGTVRADVQIPRGTATGTARVDLVGDSSATYTNVDLQVAAAETPAALRGTVPLWSLVAAAVALVGSVAALVSVSGRQRAFRRAAYSSVRV
jgi:hypothetical protein